MVVKTNLPVWQMWFYCKECGYVSFSFFPPLPSVIAFGGSDVVELLEGWFGSVGWYSRVVYTAVTYSSLVCM